MLKSPASVQACHFSTPIGEMAVAWQGETITGTFLPEASLDDLLAQVRKRSGKSALDWSPPPAFLSAFISSICAHARGKPQHYPLQALALNRLSPFFRKVYECTARIPSGAVRTYAELAAEAGSPKAFQAVGQAMARNPFPLVVPCHRVVGSSGKPGGFSAHGGLEMKARLLALESRVRSP
jgi:methylated-DNA-[protein]-cysteine S-methyltransferase